MAIQLKMVSTCSSIIDKTNEELLKLGDKVIDVEVHKDQSMMGGGYSIIKYHSDPITRKTILNESNK